ncbi:DNA replication factor Cdt1 C-terminal domain-containing protein [Aspergillus undulatus]|uniref:DNA replication factor Cdt1 C-terminal domain-containing protein n=1 Tax=Aspergillus undulatus TaxID=1810928 RepID=UPI003CCE0E71
MPRTSTRATATERLPRVASQPGIQSFARATKPGLRSSASVNLKDGKSVSTSASGLPVSPSKKRKLSELANVGSVAVTSTGKNGLETTAEQVDLTLTPSKSLKFSSLNLLSPSTRGRRSGHYVVSTGTETENETEAEAEAEALSPSRATRSARAGARAGTEIGVENAIEEQNEDETLFTPSTPSKPTRTRSIAIPRSRTANTLSPLPPAARQTTHLHPPARPAAVEELVRLHSAFLKALTIHAAHKGVTAPADLREFLPSVERIWKKRKVVVKDLQRLLWVWRNGKEKENGKGDCGFRLANHGLGRVCLERVGGRAERIEDEGVLQNGFEEAVECLWGKALDMVDGDETRVDFVATLGLASIEESLTPFTAFRKGQQRLQDLKGGVIKMKMGALAAESEQAGSGTSPTKRDATSSRRLGLLDRIKNKELRQSKLPPPPSKDVLLRRAAVGRVEEVAGVLALLRPAGYVGSGPMARMAVQRTPFCLETIIQNVQDSTRNPISDKEVEACVEILSREDVAGHWVSIVAVNQLKSVVLKSCGDVHLKEMGAKVAQLSL